jgi:protease-4
MARRGIAVVFTLLGAAFLLSIAGLVALYMFIGREPIVPSSATLTLEIGGDLAEMAPADVVTYLRGVRLPTVRSVVDNLRKAKVDRRINGVFVRLTGFSSPYWSKVQEVRDAIADFRTSGKPVYAYLEYGDDRSYYLATAADKVFLLPSSPLQLTGLATYQVFLRGTLDKVGVFPDLHHIGDYKTASNTFTEKTYTAAHREMDASLNRDLFNQVVSGIALSRKRSEAQVRALVDEGPFLPEQALRAGLIDGVSYEDQAVQQLREASSVESTNNIDGDDYARIALSALGLNRGPRIGVIYAAGAITGGRSGYDPLNGATVGSETLIRAIRDARQDSSLRALILRIDSPGGSVAASDAIWRELTIARTEQPDRPIVASMSDLAASGGYYIATPAHVIVAQPSTLTGSIGIFGGKFVSGGVYEKLGANIEVESLGKNAQMNSPARPYNADEARKVLEQLRAFYDDFVRKVAVSRNRTPEAIDQLARGRVWTGQQGKANGLVDELGGLYRAVELAKARAKIEPGSEVELVSYPAPRTFYQLLSESLSGDAQVRTINAWLQANFSNEELQALRAVRGPLSMFRRGEALALMPFAFVR